MPPVVPGRPPRTRKSASSRPRRERRRLPPASAPPPRGRRRPSPTHAAADVLVARVGGQRERQSTDGRSPHTRPSAPSSREPLRSSLTPAIPPQKRRRSAPRTRPSASSSRSCAAVGGSPARARKARPSTHSPPVLFCAGGDAQKRSMRETATTCRVASPARSVEAGARGELGNADLELASLRRRPRMPIRSSPRAGAAPADASALATRRQVVGQGGKLASEPPPW